MTISSGVTIIIFKLIIITLVRVATVIIKSSATPLYPLPGSYIMSTAMTSIFDPSLLQSRSYGVVTSQLITSEITVWKSNAIDKAVLVGECDI